jgi:glyoxylase-like metal-dependent hydrolase (beta-lactamase superfamily II)/rhodanese-related sulfurtransferase
MDVFDSAGLRLSAGSACSATSVKPSHVLDAMGVPSWRSTSALRLSFGPNTSEKEINRGCQIIRECAIALKNTCLLETSGSFEAPENLRDGILQFRIGSTNSWILANRESRNCVIIDPCETVAERMEQYVRCQNLDVLAILDTHSHADHDSIRPVLQKVLADRFKNLNATYDNLGWPTFKSDFVSIVLLEDGTSVPMIRIHSFGADEFILACLKTSGHTDDSQTFLCGLAKDGILKKENVFFAFCGDTILSGGLGRTNFSVSNPEALFHSLRQLQMVLHPNTLLCPAHDYNSSFSTHLKTEIDENPLLALALSPMTPLTLDLFLQKKKEIDTELCKLEDNFPGIVCGVTPTSQPAISQTMTIPADQLQEYLKNTPTPPLLIDVRESQEFSLFKDWGAIGFSPPPRNVPLSRIVNFMSELLKAGNLQQEILFICRTGNRSLHVTRSLRRLGFTRAWSLEGGVALSTRPNGS